MSDAVEPVAGGTCVHHWLIGPPVGETSSGVCKRCGETRTFLTTPERFALRSNQSARAATTPSVV